MGHVSKKAPKQGKRLNLPSEPQNLSDANVSTNGKPPIFSFHLIKKEYGIDACTSDEKSALIDTIYKRSQKTWQELNDAPKKGLGYEKILHTSIKGVKVPDDIKKETLLAFRFCGRAPMVGYREGQIFHILWLDRNFTLYDHGS